jgi:hypothetical protein
VKPRNHLKNGAELKSHMSRIINLTKMKKINTYLMILTSIALMNCNQIKLSGTEATELIQKNLKLPHDHNISILSHSSNEDYFNLLQQNGLITWKFDWVEYWAGSVISRSYECEISLTDKGAPFLIEKNSNENPYPSMNLFVYKFKGYTINLNTITGISVNKENQSATVRYILKASNITPFAESLQGTKYVPHALNSDINGELVFKQFDTGWQLATVQD